MKKTIRLSDESHRQLSILKTVYQESYGGIVELLIQREFLAQEQKIKDFLQQQREKQKTAETR